MQVRRRPVVAVKPKPAATSTPAPTATPAPTTPTPAPTTPTPPTTTTTTPTTTTTTTTPTTRPMAPLPTGAHARPIAHRADAIPENAAPAGQAALAAALGASGTPAERAENAARFAALTATWHEPIDGRLAASFAALDALRDQVAAARATATPAGLAAAAAVAADVERRSFGASKTLSSDWKEGKDVGRKLARQTAAHIAQLAASGAPISEAALSTINTMVRPDDKANARGVKIGAYRSPTTSKETEFLKRCVPPRHLDAAMRGIVTFLNDAAARGMHPIERAGRAYHGLVNNHAYSDGNGRTSRAAMDWILQAAGFPPVALDDPKVLSFDTATRTTTPGMPQKAVEQVVEALTRQLTATLQALQTTTNAPPTPTTGTPAPRKLVPLRNGAPAFSNRDYRFLDVPRALHGHTIEAHAGGDVGPRQWTAEQDGPFFVAADAGSALQAAGFTRTKHTLRYSDKARTTLEVWRKDARAGDVVDAPAAGWAGVRRILPG